MDDKLDRIIELLEQINDKLAPAPAISRVEEERAVPMEKTKPIKPTAKQIQTKRSLELICRLDGKNFLKVWKQHVADIVEIRKTEPDFYPVFNPQGLRWFDTKLKTPNTPFYIELRKEIQHFCDGVTLEGRKMLDKLLPPGK